MLHRTLETETRPHPSKTTRPPLRALALMYVDLLWPLSGLGSWSSVRRLRGWRDFHSRNIRPIDRVLNESRGANLGKKRINASSSVLLPAESVRQNRGHWWVALSSRTPLFSVRWQAVKFVIVHGSEVPAPRLRPQPDHGDHQHTRGGDTQRHRTTDGHATVL